MDDQVSAPCPFALSLSKGGAEQNPFMVSFGKLRTG
jgi:hypothetical protein